MSDYIKRGDAVEAVWRILNGMGISQKHNDRLVEEVGAVFDEYPAADVRPVVRGRWLPTSDANKKRCSRCDVIHLIAQYPHGEINYCPNCGAMMEEEL